MLEHLTVALIVALAAFYAGARYLPKSWRERAVFLLAKRGFEQSKMARWFNTQAECASGCASCKACADPVQPEPLARRVIKLHVQK